MSWGYLGGEAQTAREKQEELRRQMSSMNLANRQRAQRQVDEYQGIQDTYGKHREEVRNRKENVFEQIGKTFSPFVKIVEDVGTAVIDNQTGGLATKAKSWENPFDTKGSRFDVGSTGRGMTYPNIGSVGGGDRIPSNAELRAAQAKVTAMAGGLTRGISGEFAKTETRLRDLMPKGRGRDAVQEGEFHNEL